MGRTKNELTTVGEPLTKQQSREAMLDARRRVRNMLKGKNPEGFLHMGEMPTSYDDAIRIIVALQDEFENEKAAHNKATVHVASLLESTDMLCQDLNASMISTMVSQSETGESIQSLSHQRDELAKQRDEASQRVRGYCVEIFELRKEKEALLQTISVLSKGRS